MSLKFRLYDHLAFCNKIIQCRYCTTVAGKAHNVVTVGLVEPESSTCSLAANRRKEAESARPSSLLGLLEEGRRFVDILSGNADQGHLQKQVQELQAQLASLAVVPYKFQDRELQNTITRCVPQAMSPKQNSSLSDTSFLSLVDKKYATPDSITSLLFESKYVQRYAYNADDILVHRVDSDYHWDSVKQPFDGVALDEHFGVSSQPDLLCAPKHLCDRDPLELDTSPTESCKVPAHDEVNQAYSDKYHYNDAEWDSYFERYKDHESSMEFPAFHVHMTTPQFTGVTSFPSDREELGTAPSGVLSASTVPVVPGPAFGVLDGQHVVLMSGGQEHDKVPDDRQQRPNLDHLMRLQEHLADNLPKLLKKTTDYRIYRADVILENNYRDKPYVTKGITAYAMEILKLRLWAHFKFANVRLQLLKITLHEDEGVVQVHWRFSGLPQVQAFMFWKFLPGMYRKRLNAEAEWYEGIANFHVDGDGAVYKVIVDRTLSDKNLEVVAKPSMRQKLESLLTPKPAIGGSALTPKPAA